jgi:hypothetical protein
MLMSDPPPARAGVSAPLGTAVAGTDAMRARCWSGCAVRHTWSPSLATRPRILRSRSQEVSIVTESWDDEAVLAALREAVRAREAVPAEFVEAGKNAFVWHNIDAELAQLTYDSTRDPAYAPTVRAEDASIRALTFTSAHLTIELEVSRDSLLGQIIPAQAAMIKIQPRTGSETAIPTDEIGRFSVQPIPSGPFRLHCRTGAGHEALTGWITL